MKNYQQLAMRTNAPGVGSHGNVPADMIHAVLGMMDETEEYERASSDTNAREEIGDPMWFVSLAAESLKIDLMWDDLPPPENRALFFSEVGAIAGLVKKPYAYGPDKPLPAVEIGIHLRKIIGIAVAVCNDCGWSLPDILEANIAKLRTRFPEKFEADQAWNRDTEAEALAIEQCSIVRTKDGSLTMLSDEARADLESFVKGAAAYQTMVKKEHRDQVIAEYEHKYRVVDTRMIGAALYVVAGW